MCLESWGWHDEARVYVVIWELEKYLLYQRGWRICCHTLHAMYLEKAPRYADHKVYHQMTSITSFAIVPSQDQ